MVRELLLITVISTLLIDCSRSSLSDTVDSQTHWLTKCKDNDECGGLSCFCGVCVKACDTENICDVAGRRTECQSANSDAVRSLCEKDAPVSICLEPCNKTCLSGQRCSFGSCIPAPGDQGGAGGERASAGVGGSAAMGGNGGSRAAAGGKGGSGAGGVSGRYEGTAGASGEVAIGQGGGGMGGQVSDGGAGGVQPGLSVQCGQNACTAQQFPIEYVDLSPDGSRTALACCAGEGLNSCGLLIKGGCVELGQPGVSSGYCPRLEGIMAQLAFEGCCKPDGTCGFSETILGLGCFFLPKIADYQYSVPYWCDPDAGPPSQGSAGTAG